MSQSAPATITLKGSPPIKELNAAGAITPGHVVTRGSGNTLTVAGANYEGPVQIALEQDFVGKGIDTAYASGDRVQFACAQPGDEFNVLVPAAASAIVIGDLLQTGAGGTMIKRTTTNRIVAIALAAVDNSAGGTAVRLKVEIV